MNFVLSVASVLAVSSPLLLVLIVGLALAFARWQRHPRLSLLVAIAIGGLLLVRVTGAVTSTVLPLALRDSGWETSAIGGALGALGLLFALVEAGCWVLLLIALFGSRDADR